MIIIGHKAIEFSAFKKIESIENIADTNANEIVWFQSNISNSYDIAKHLYSVSKSLFNTIRTVIPYRCP